MGEEETGNGNSEPANSSSAADGVSREIVLQWVIGLPSSEELIPLTQSLISPELATAFSINLDGSPHLCGTHDSSAQQAPSARNLRLPMADESLAVEWQEEDEEEADASVVWTGNSCAARTVKKPRLAWTPQLHNKFAELVAHLGEKAVPKTIMQLMNVEGLTRKNVSSHLQKYRIYQKKMQGILDEGPSSLTPDPLFDQAPEPTHKNELLPQAPSMIPLPVLGSPHHRWYQKSCRYYGCPSSL